MTTTINVQFASAAADATIISYFGAPQDQTVWPNMGVTTTDDPRWKTFYESAGFLGQTGLPTPTSD